MSKIELSVSAGEKALLELIAEGRKISQHAVEARAGVANGAFNYAHPMYLELRNKIRQAKIASKSDQTQMKKEHATLLTKERALKHKYFSQRNELKEQLRMLEGEKLELQYQLYHLQKYLAQIEDNGIDNPNVIGFAPLNK